MELSKMSIPEIEARLLNLWNKADSLKNGSPEYDAIVDEILAIHTHVRENSLVLSPEIAARF